MSSYFPGDKCSQKLTFFFIPALNIFNHIISTHHVQSFIHVSRYLIIVIGFGLWINLMILSLRWTILFAERKFYDANIVLDSFQNRVLKTHLNFTSLSSESRVPSFYALASTQLPYLIFHSFKIQWKRNIYVFLFLLLSKCYKGNVIAFFAKIQFPWLDIYSANFYDNFPN